MPTWNGHTVQIDFKDKVGGVDTGKGAMTSMTFTSNIAEQVYGAPKQYDGL